MAACARRFVFVFADVRPRQSGRDRDSLLKATSGYKAIELVQSHHVMETTGRPMEEGKQRQRGKSRMQLQRISSGIDTTSVHDSFERTPELLP